MSAEHTTSRTLNAFVLIKTEPEAAPAVAARIRDAIQRADVVLVDGEYDIVVSLESDGEEYVNSAVKNHMRTARGVIRADVLFANDVVRAPLVPSQAAPLGG